MPSVMVLCDHAAVAFVKVDYYEERVHNQYQCVCVKSAPPGAMACVPCGFWALWDSSPRQPRKFGTR